MDLFIYLLPNKLVDFGLEDLEQGLTHLGLDGQELHWFVSMFCFLNFLLFIFYGILMF